MDSRHLNHLSIDLKGPLGFILCGKLVAENFVHFGRCIDIHVLIVVEKGVLNIELNGMRYKVREGEAFLMPAKCFHNGFCDEDTRGGIKYFWAHFVIDNDFCFNGQCGNDIRIPIYFKLNNPARVNILYNQLLDISKLGTVDLRYCSFLFTALVCELAFQAKSERISSNNLVNKAVSWIELHIEEPISLDSVSSALEYNKRYLSRVFKEYMKISVNKYIEKCKMELAKKMLTGSDEQVTGIARQLGYEDACYFMRVFKKYEGITCTQYRSAYSRMYLNHK